MTLATSNSILALALLASALAGCTTTDPYTRREKVSNTTQEVGAGVVQGAVLGGLLCAANGGRGCDKAMAIGIGMGVAAGLNRGMILDSYDARLLQEFKAAGVSASERGSTVVLNTRNGILFPAGGDRPSGSGMQSLRAIAKVLAHYPGYGVDVIGHTASDEDAALGEARAAFAAHVLSSHGVMSSRIQARGVGSSEPLRTEASESGRANNRVVEIFIAPRL